MRCAIYSRYSSDRQKATSIDDQIRKCRQYSDTRDGWVILDEYVFKDEAASGTRSDRDGFNEMLAAAKRKPRPFDVLLVDDTSRFARDLPFALTQMELLNYLGIEIHFVAQGMSSSNEQFRMNVTVHGMMDEQYVSSLSQKTKRGLEGTAIRGQHTGGRCFGYKNTPIYGERLDAFGHRIILGSKLEIDQEQADIVRRIFTMYADGMSFKKIAKQLNAEGVQAPVPQLHRVQQSWAHTTLRAMILNERYRGVVIFGKTRKIRNPITKKRVKRTNDAADKVTLDVPQQRIVSGELWSRVRHRIEAVKRAYGDERRTGKLSGLTKSGSAVSNAYLFSGLLKCSECGANLQLVSGRGKHHRQPDYGCPMNKFRGTCSNNMTIPKDVLERQLLSKIQSEVLNPEVVEYTLRRFEEEVTKAMRNVASEMTSLDAKRKRLEAETTNLARAIAGGLDSPAVRSELVKREAELKRLTEQITSSQPDSIRVKIQDTRKYVESSLRDIRALLNSSPQTAKAVLARHMPKIVLKPTVKPDGRKVFQVVSEWELIENDAVRVECAEGQS